MFHNAQVWPSSTPSQKVISINLNPSAVQTYINFTPAPVLDLYIQDDTNVDYIQVTHTYH